MLSRRRRVISAVVVAVFTAAVLGPVGPAPAAPLSTTRPAAAEGVGVGPAVGMGPAAGVGTAGRAHTVTLVTGDRVTVSAGGKVGISRAEGRSAIGFLTRRVEGHLRVTPGDALPLIRAGRLDPRLFDVTLLIEFGYDSSRADLPLLMTVGGAARRAARSTVTDAGGTVVREVPAVNGLSVRIPTGRLTGLWQRLTGGAAASRSAGVSAGGVSKVWLGGPHDRGPGVGVPRTGARDLTERAEDVIAEPASVDFGRQRWPHADDAPVTRTVTYRNLATNPLTLALSMQVTGPTGQSAPAGLLTLGADRLTVPAGGRASVTLTADTRVDGPDGHYTGRLAATGGGATVTTPVTVEREVESYDVTIRHLDRTGGVPLDYFTSLVRTDRGGAIDLWEPGGTVRARLPRATYALTSQIFTAVTDGGPPEETLLIHPAVEVTHTLTLTVDSRRGRPISVRVPHADASPASMDVMAEVYGEGFSTALSVGSQRLDRFFTAQLGPDRSYPWLRSTVSGVLTRAAAVDGAETPYIYNVSWRFDGRIPTGVTKRLTPAELATVYVRHARQGHDLGDKFTFGTYPDLDLAAAWGVRLRVPAEYTEYHTTAGGVRWQPNWLEFAEAEQGREFYARLEGPEVSLSAGQVYHQTWNGGVFGPSLVHPIAPEEYLTRQGDRIAVLVPLFSDGEDRYGFSATGSGRVTIYRAGVMVAEAGELGVVTSVPAGDALYRVEMAAARGAPSILSREVTAVWTFRSGHVDGDVWQRLPVSVVRFSPDLSLHNSASAGRTFTIGVRVQPQEGAAARPCAALSVQVSYDDGRTWAAPATVTGSGQVWQVRITHPETPGYVSLRATARDTAGNTVEQTIIRAYRTTR